MIRPRVQVIDADPASQALIRKVLARHCDLLLQETPRATLDAMELFEPDLIILDLELPLLGGFEVLKLIRSAEPAGLTRVMVFSALHEVEVQKEAYRLGANYFLAKPCRPSQLFKAAAMFFRLAVGGCGDCAAKRFTQEEVSERLAEREERGQVHPLTAAALAAHERNRTLEPGRPSILAFIARSRPAA